MVTAKSLASLGLAFGAAAYCARPFSRLGHLQRRTVMAAVSNSPRITPTPEPKKVRMFLPMPDFLEASAAPLCVCLWGPSEMLASLLHR